VDLTIALLGTPRIEIEGAPLSVDTRKAVALLAYLAVTGHAQSRDRLASLLWPEYDGDRARAALRRTLSTLKAGLGGRGLVIDRAVVSLATTDAEIDIRAFRELARVAEGATDEIESLANAVALHRDDLLAGFSLKDSVEFDSWQQAAASELRRELAHTLGRLTRALARAGRHDAAIVHARRRLALDPLDEPSHRQLIELLAATGNRAEALRQYRECVRHLDRELGVRPLPETTELYLAVNEGRLAADPLPSVLPPPVPPRVLVGRDHEWAQLVTTYAACARDGNVVVLEGEAGIGKTRLGEELVSHARSLGGVAVAVRPHPGEQVLPYGLIAGSLRAARAEWDGTEPEGIDPAALAEAARLVPELAAETPPAPSRGPGARQRFYDALAQTLTAFLAGPAPGVIFLDDLQWADQASLDVLAYLVRRLATRPLLILAAWRPQELAREQAPVQALETYGSRIALSRLTPSDVAELVAHAGADRETAERLYEESLGLPLFVVEYLAAARDGAGVGMPRGVRALLVARLRSVGEASSQLLAAAAVLGRSFDYEALRDTSGRSDEEVVAGLEELTVRAIVVEHDDGYGFSHEQLRTLVLERTSHARRRLLHRRTAGALQRSHGNPATIAHHLEGAGDAAQAAVAHVEAAAQARRLFAYSDALEHLAAALALDHPDPAAQHEAIGDVQTLLGEYRAALAAFEAAAATGPIDRLARIEHKLGGVYNRRGQWDLAERHLQAAIELGGDEQARVYADRSLTARRRGDHATALALAERALELARTAGDDEALAQAHNINGMLRGDRRHLEQSLAIAETLADPTIAVAALNNLSLASARAGDPGRALELTARALDICSRQGDRHREAALHNNLADLLHHSGRSDEAMAHLKWAAALFAEVGGNPDEMEPEVWMLVEW
jgi:DNA-binding SARP family transcriptional activator